MSNDIYVCENGDEYKITFRYDPDAVTLVKTIPGRRWHPEDKFWSIPKEKLGWLITASAATKFKGHIHIRSSENLNKNEMLGVTNKIPDIDISDVLFYTEKGKKPYKHQIDFMKYMKYRQRTNLNGVILADEMGAGKTYECLQLALYNKQTLGFKRCLIIACVNSAKYNWVDDITKHTQGKYIPYLLGTRYKKNGQRKLGLQGSDKLDDLLSCSMTTPSGKRKALPYFIVLNIEALRAKEGKHYTVSEAIINLINNSEVDMVILDEIHKNASPQSTQGKQLLAIKKAVNRCMWIPVTGTPLVNKPTDVFLPLKLVDGHNYNSYYMWCQQFCVYGGFSDHEIVGYKNIPLLKNMLESNMIRRLKSDILDLPDKIEYIEYVENTSIQKRLYVQVQSDIIKDKANIQSSLNPLAKFMRLRQVNGSPEVIDDTIHIDKSYLKQNAKLTRLLELISDVILRNEKVLIFSNWVEPLRTIYRFLSSHYDVATITGTMSIESRESSKQRFMSDVNCRILLGTVGAMGTSHTLTAANNIIFYDEPWTPADKQQCIDRVHRIGSNKSVNVYTLITKDTIDERVHQILYDKHTISKYIVDNNLDIQKDPKLFDFLVGK